MNVALVAAVAGLGGGLPSSESGSHILMPAPDHEALQRTKETFPQHAPGAGLGAQPQPCKAKKRVFSKRANVRNFFGKVTKIWRYDMTEYGFKPRNN